nr:hypothetical protein [Lachnospiraceae bacterium]
LFTALPDEAHAVNTKTVVIIIVAKASFFLIFPPIHKNFETVVNIHILTFLLFRRKPIIVPHGFLEVKNIP